MGPLENLSYGRSPVVPLIVSSEERPLTERGKKAIAMFIGVALIQLKQEVGGNYPPDL
ncbi:hypothetical protein A2U01_0038007, partial [Trifolium medium]|nr:hypothetical protein [Trifolium medium]